MGKKREKSFKEEFRDKLFKSLRSRNNSPVPAISPPNFLRKPHEELWRPPPEFARDVDIEFCQKAVDVKRIFQYLVPVPENPAKSSCKTASQFFNKLAPAEVRAKICSYCLPSESRKISLSPYFILKAVYSEAYHASPWDVLENVLGGIHAFRVLRLDLMKYFWTQYRFHVTLSMVSGPIFAPLTHAWLPHYLGIIQDLTIELDLTGFGASALKHAESFGYDYRKVERQLTEITLGIYQRRNEIPMAKCVPPKQHD